MKVSILDLGRRIGHILRALKNNEPVTILCGGKEKAVIYPYPARCCCGIAVMQHPACGMWKDRVDLQDVDRTICKLRKTRHHAV
jgi:hypothetical protein